MECIWDQGSERILHYAVRYSTSSTGPPRPYIPRRNSFLFLRPLTWILSCRRGTNICVPSQSAAHLQSSARPSAVYSTATDALRSMFFLVNVLLTSLQGTLSFCLGIVFAYISYEVFPWFLSFKVSFNEVK